MGYRLNHLDEPVFITVPKPILTVFGIHHRLESCGVFYKRNYGKRVLVTQPGGGTAPKSFASIPGGNDPEGGCGS